MHYVYLFFAVVAEVIATSAVQSSQQFTKLGPSIVVIIGYSAAFYLLSLTLKFMPVGIVYAIWSGFGVVLIAFVGFALFDQQLDWPAVAGLGLIVAGILVINLFSTTVTH